MARSARPRRAAPTPPPADPTTAYALDVTAGRIVAGQLVRHAAERHLRDLRDGPARGLHWRPEQAARALGFFPAVLAVTAGAMAGRPFHLLGWHLFTVGSLFGWRRADGLRRFRTAYMETGKGQAKSPLMAGVGLYLGGFCDTPRAEVYAIAGDKDQANVLFRDAVAMCRADIPDSEHGDTLEARGVVLIRGTGDMAWKIEWPESGSKFQALASGDAISGPRPVCVLADEIHEMKTEAPLELWSAALTKMPGDPLMMLGTNTPAAGQIVGTDYSEYYQRVASGDFDDDSSFAYIARTDESDDPVNDESCWVKSLPALGITYPVENVRGEVQKARGMPGKMLAVKRLYFGIPVGASEYWIDVDAWESSLGSVDERDMIGLPCWLGLDLSQRNDLTALAAVWKRPDGQKFAKVWYWKPAGLLQQAVVEDKAPYDKWAASGILSVVPGKTIGKDFVAAKVQEVCVTQAVEAMAFDRAYIKDFLAESEKIGFPCWIYEGAEEPTGTGLRMVRHSQGAQGLHSDKNLWMPRSVQALEDDLLNGALTIDKTGLTTWCSANAALVLDGSGNRFFDKKRSRGRIDGIVALAMANGAASVELPKPAGSIWDRPELWGGQA